MRLALLALCFVGCFPIENDDDWDRPQGGGWGSGWGGGGGTSGYGCEADSECGGLTCTRTGECLPAAQVRAARTIWTLGDAAASDVSCRRAPNLAITFFSSTNEQFGFHPVPCDAG